MTELPKRLLDDPTVSARLRADLARAIETPPDALDLADGLERLERLIEDSAPPPAPRPPAAPASLPSVSSIAAAAIAGVAVVGAIVTWMAPPAPSSTPRRDEPEVSRIDGGWADRGRPDRGLAGGEPVGGEPIEGEPVDGDVAAEPPSMLERSASDPSSVDSSPSVSRADDRDEPTGSEVDQMAELEDLVLARRTLESDPAAALERIERAHRRYRGGRFGEEREAIRIRALVRLGRLDEARSRAARFLERYPESGFAERVRRETSP